MFLTRDDYLHRNSIARFVFPNIHYLLVIGSTAIVMWLLDILTRFSNRIK
jgi:hypothetical protein